MWRQLISTTVSAFKMFSRTYKTWFGFGMVFTLFFLLIGFALGAAVLFPLGELFHGKYINSQHLPDKANIWWVNKCLYVSGCVLVFAVGLFAAYMRKHDAPESFGHFLRFVPTQAWKAFFGLSLLTLLVTYGSIYTTINDVRVVGWPVQKVFDWVPMFVVYACAGIVYLSALNKHNYRIYSRSMAIFQTTDLAITFAVNYALGIISGLFFYFEILDSESYWGSCLMAFALIWGPLLFTISFYASLLYCSFPAETEEMEFEFETGGPYVVKK